MVSYWLHGLLKANYWLLGLLDIRSYWLCGYVCLGQNREPYNQSALHLGNPLLRLIEITEYRLARDDVCVFQFLGGERRDGKRSECPKGNNMPAASERARWMGRGNIIFGHQGYCRKEMMDGVFNG